MNLTKSLEYFDPNSITKQIHIIGCGAIGSTIAENLTRLGVKELHLWDFDTVEEQNIANQMFRPNHIKMEKVDALEEILLEINPEIIIKKHNKGWNNDFLSGYLFLCVDKISVRKDILKSVQFNQNITAIFDSRMRLTDAQHYASSWASPEQKEFLLNTMDFTDEEAQEATPTSACGTTLSLCYTVRTVAALAVNNFITKALENKLYKTITINLQPIEILAFEE